jgi:hypothetical protein
VLNDKLGKLTKPGRSREWQAFVHAGNKRIQGRLCAVRLPKDKAEQARTRGRKEQGAAVTKDTLRMAEFVVVFTTVPRDKLTSDLILELYRLRWQVELEFKRDKSITGLDRLPNFRPDTIEAWLYAKLLLHQITRKLAASVGDFPPVPSPTPPSEANHKQPKPRHPHDAWADRPWQLTKLLWNLLPSALLPARLISTIESMSRFVAHLRKKSGRRVRKLDVFRNSLRFFG